MNTENGNVNGAVVTQPQIEMFGGLFKADGELAGVLRHKKSKSGSMRICLLPAKSKYGDSLAKVSGMKGAALEAYGERRADGLHAQLSAVDGVLGSSPDWRRTQMTMNAKGNRCTIVFQKRAGNLSVEGVLATLTEDELMAELDKRAGVAPKQVEAAVAE